MDHWNVLGIGSCYRIERRQFAHTTFRDEGGDAFDTGIAVGRIPYKA